MRRRDRRKFHHANAGEYAERGGCQYGAARQHDIARPHLGPARQHVLAGLHERIVDPHAIRRRRLRLLHHHDGIRAIGHRRAGEDPYRFARRNALRRHRTCRHFLDHDQFHGRCGIDGANRVAVHHRLRERRRIDIRTHVGGEHLPERRRRQRRELRLPRRRMANDNLKSHRNIDHGCSSPRCVTTATAHRHGASGRHSLLVFDFVVTELPEAEATAVLPRRRSGSRSIDRVCNR